MKLFFKFVLLKFLLTLNSMLILPSISLKKKEQSRFETDRRNQRSLLSNTEARATHIALDRIEAKLKKISSQKLGKCGIFGNQNGRIKEEVVQKVWLIRKIGDLLTQDTKAINDKRKKLKQRVSKNYKKYNRKADKLLNLIQQEGNSADERQFRKLRETLR